MTLSTTNQGYSLAEVLENHRLWLEDPNAGGRCRFTGKTLNEAKLTNALLKMAILERATFLDADLAGADLSGAELDNVDFDRAVLTSVGLTGARIVNTKFA